MRSLPALLLLAACAAAPAQPPPPEGHWRVEALRGEALPDAPRPAEINFVPGRYAAIGGCNRIAGQWEGTGTALAFRPGAMTRMACPPPLDVQETAFVQALAEVRALSDGTAEAMALLDAQGREVMRLRRLPSPRP